MHSVVEFCIFLYIQCILNRAKIVSTILALIQSIEAALEQHRPNTDCLSEYRLLWCTMNVRFGYVLAPHHIFIVDQKSTYSTQLLHASTDTSIVEAICMSLSESNYEESQWQLFSWFFLWIEKQTQGLKVKIEVHFHNFLVIFKPEKNRKTRETRGSGSGWGGLDLFRPRGAIGRGPEGP